MNIIFVIIYFHYVIKCYITMKKYYPVYFKIIRYGLMSGQKLLIYVYNLLLSTRFIISPGSEPLLLNEYYKKIITYPQRHTQQSYN